MPATALVTARASDLSALPRPGWKPLVRITPDKPGTTLDGFAVPTEPVEMVDDGTGLLTARLIVSEAFVTHVRYVVTVDWLSPSGGTPLREVLPTILVTEIGGTIGDLALTPTPHGLAWEGETPPPLSMLWLYMDPDYDPELGGELPVYVTVDGERIEHGELVDWQTPEDEAAEPIEFVTEGIYEVKTRPTGAAGIYEIGN